MEVRIRPRALLGTLTAIVVVLLPILGIGVSPRDVVGRPVLLLPDVREMEQYRRQAREWVGDWAGVAETLNEVLSGDETQLLRLSRKAQRAFELSVAVAREIDATEVPSALLGLRDLATQVAADYVGASVAVARWLSAPSTENLAAAEQAVLVAKDGFTALESNEWVSERSSNQR